MRNLLATRIKRLETKLPPPQQEKRVIRIAIEDPLVPADQLVTIKVDVPWWPA
jgi:hypothetical protein